MILKSTLSVQKNKKLPCKRKSVNTFLCGHRYPLYICTKTHHSCFDTFNKKVNTDYPYSALQRSTHPEI